MKTRRLGRRAAITMAFVAVLAPLLTGCGQDKQAELEAQLAQIRSQDQAAQQQAAIDQQYATLEQILNRPTVTCRTERDWYGSGSTTTCS